MTDIEQKEIFDILLEVRQKIMELRGKDYSEGRTASIFSAAKTATSVLALLEPEKAIQALVEIMKNDPSPELRMCAVDAALRVVKREKDTIDHGLVQLLYINLRLLEEGTDAALSKKGSEALASIRNLKRFGGCLQDVKEVYEKTLPKVSAVQKTGNKLERFVQPKKNAPEAVHA